MFTVIEGDSWGRSDGRRGARRRGRGGPCTRVSVVIKADWRSGVTDAMTSKTESVERHLSRRSSAGPNVVAVSARAGIVVTGTEVLTGRVADRNGPWIADRLLELGVELAHITICGDRAADIEAQLRFMADEGVDLIVTSGGLGPTADDMTVATVAQVLRTRTGAGRRAGEQDRGDLEEVDVRASGPAISTRCAPPTASRPWSRSGRW